MVMRSPCSTNPIALHRFLVAFASSVPLLAQVVSTPPRGQQLVTVTSAAANEYVGCSTSGQNGLTPARDGSLFVLVVRTVFAGADRNGPAVGDLELWRSTDGGAGWSRVAAAPTRGDADGALVATDDGLAVAWNSSNGEAWSSVWFQRFDVGAAKWIGEPECLARGRGEEDQYFCSDIGRTTSGALVVAIGSHRSPPTPWTCGWSTGMRWLPNGATAWSELVQVNVGSYGVMGSLIARGDEVDFTYRTNPDWGTAVNGVRTFATKSGSFTAAKEEVAMRAPEAGALIANTGMLVVDDIGGRTLLHVLAAEEPGRGRLAASFSRGGGSWQTNDVADDPPLCAGNLNPTHFTLARGPGSQVFAYFAKQSESFANLWQCTLEDGAVATPPKIVARGEANAFVTMTGMRASGCFSGLHVATTSRTQKQPGGVVSVFGSWPAKTVWTRAAK